MTKGEGLTWYAGRPRYLRCAVGLMPTIVPLAPELQTALPEDLRLFFQPNAARLSGNLCHHNTAEGRIDWASDKVV